MRVQKADFSCSVLKTSSPKSFGSQFSLIRNSQMNDIVDLSTKQMNIKSGLRPSCAINFTGVGAVFMDKITHNRSVTDSGLDFIRSQYEILVKKFPEDVPYYKQLASDMGLAGEEFRLYSVVGKSQLSDILAKASPTDFAINSDYSGIKNLTHRINLHNHLKYSDGKLSAYDFLEQSKNYGDKIAEKFPGKFYTRGISDHDIMDGGQEALRIIAQNPYKYRNLKLEVGSELSVSHVNPEDVKAPMDFELILYSSNPFNKKFNSFLANTRNNRNEVVKSFINDLNNKYPNLNLNWDEACKFNPNLEKGTSNGSLWLARDYAVSKLGTGADKTQVNSINKLRDQYLTSESGMINSKITVTPAQVFDAFRESENVGMFGVAHPGFLGAGMYSDKISQYCSNRTDREPAHHLVWVLFNRLKQDGKGLFRCSESNYQSYGSDSSRIPWVKYVNKVADELGLLKAGGVDCHTKYLFLKHDDMPEQKIKELKLDEIIGVA